MPLDGERWRLKARLGVAKIAFVLEGNRGELAAMLVGMASGADHLADDKDGRTPCGWMATGTRDRRVFSFERKGAVTMSFTIKFRRLETRFVVT